MSSNQESIETKAGHPPALKVGGVRIAQRQRRDSEENSKTKDKIEKPVEEVLPPTFNIFKPPVMVTVATNADQKDVVKAETKHAHEKPVPTHQPAAHLNKPTVIQQPRK